MASQIYDGKKQIIEDKRIKRKDEAVQKCTDIVQKSNKNRLSIGVSIAEGFYVSKWLLIAVVVICALTESIEVGAFALVLWFCGTVGVSIYLSYRSNNKADREVINARTEEKRTIDNIEKDYQNELNQLDLWYKNYEENVKNQAQKYCNGTEAPKLAQRMEEQFERLINDARRDPKIKVIDVDYDFIVGKDQIDCGLNRTYAFPAINFEQERLNSLQSDIQCEALAQAIARMIKASFKKKYPNDNVSIKHDDASVYMHYTGINPKYVPKKNI